MAGMMTLFNLKMCRTQFFVILIRTERLCVSFVGLLAVSVINCNCYIFICAGIAFVTATIDDNDSTCPSEFPDNFCLGIMGYLRSVHCIGGKGLMSCDTTISKQFTVSHFFY